FHTVDAVRSHLAVIKSPLDGNVVDVLIQDSSHLGLLDWTDSSLWMENENTDILLSSQTVDGGTAGVSTGGSNDGQMMSLLTFLYIFVLSSQEVLEEISNKLKGDILEGESRAVEEFEKVDILLWNQRNDWRNL